VSSRALNHLLLYCGALTWPLPHPQLVPFFSGITNPAQLSLNRHNASKHSSPPPAEEVHVEILSIFPMYIQHTTLYSFTLFVFLLRLSSSYITTAQIYIMVVYCLFGDNILGFNMCFPIRCLGFPRCLGISYAPFLVMILLIIAPHPADFTHIIWDLLGWISGSNMLALMFFTLFFLYFFCAYGRTLCYK